MADPMNAFWSRLGASAFADVAGCDCGIGDDENALGLAPGETTVDASLAMSRAVSQYVALSQQGETLRQMMIAGVKIPCEVWAAYASARQDYLTKSQYLFDQLAAKNVLVEQVVYSAGKPVQDPSDPSKIKTLRVAAPLRPPAFIGLNCAGVPNMSGAQFSQPIGWEPVPVSLGSISSTVLTAFGGTAANVILMLTSGGVLLGLSGYGAYKTIKQIAVILRDYDASPSRILAAYTSCFQTSVKAGASTADAAKQCQGVQESAQKSREAIAKSNAEAEKAKGIGVLGWIGLGAVVLVIGGIVIRVLQSKAAAAARLMVPMAGAVRRRRLRQYSQPGDPILIGDVYIHPRSR